MKIKVQTCWGGHGFYFRALTGGSVLIRSEDGIWRRSDAIAMLDSIIANGHPGPRNRIRFVHV